MKKTKGFTLIELLIVIAVLGILVVAILSALDPLEQIRKARDAGKKSDSAEMLAAYERYFTTYQCYPWDTAAPICTAEVTRTTTQPDFTGCGGATPGPDCDLIEQGELKNQFQNRGSVVVATPTSERLQVTEDPISRQMSVCYEPESRSARQGGLGPTRTIDNTGTSTCNVPATGGFPDGSCFVCVPQ